MLADGGFLGGGEVDIPVADGGGLSVRLDQLAVAHGQGDKHSETGKRQKCGDFQGSHARVFHGDSLIQTAGREILFFGCVFSAENDRVVAGRVIFR